MPIYFDVFVAPIRDSQTAQVAAVTMLTLILMDVLFGLVAAIINKDFSSEKMRAGVGHKAAEIGFAILALVADATLIGGLDIGLTAPVFVASCTYICLMEVGSLMEILVKANPELGSSPLFVVLRDVKGKVE